MRFRRIRKMRTTDRTDLSTTNGRGKDAGRFGFGYTFGVSIPKDLTPDRGLCARQARHMHNANA